MSSGIDRVAAIRELAPLLRDEILVTSLGISSWSWFAADDRPLNLYTQGSMGLVSSIGLGLALAQPGRTVVTVEGEGSLLMNLGSLATIASVDPPNLVMLVWDDSVYGTTGGQTSHSARTDLASIAAGAGLASGRYGDIGGLTEAFKTALNSKQSATLLVAEADPEQGELKRSRMHPLVAKHRLMQSLGTCRCHPSTERQS